MAEQIKRIVSGTKYQTPQGRLAIKDGIKAGGLKMFGLGSASPLNRKPAWLRVRLPVARGAFKRTQAVVRSHRLATVCEESHCPNISECWDRGTATIMLMGAVCTRACRFCAVDTGHPGGWLDPEEPMNVARSVALMDLRYIVLTSVDRDDLPDGGAAHFAATVAALKTHCPGVAVEALTPDFNGDIHAVRRVAQSGLTVFAQNLETVRRLTRLVRDPRAGYEQTLAVLQQAKQSQPGLLTKTSILLGLGETKHELITAMRDLRQVGCDILTLGQYLRPTLNHLPLRKWVAPEEFNQWRRIGLEQGFREVAAGPLVRSSYRAERILEGNNLGLAEGEPSTAHLIAVNQL